MVAEPVSIRAFTTLPDDIGPLLKAAETEGHDLVRRLVDDWVDGSNRFDRKGEVALAAWADSRLVAVGGLNRDPYLDSATVGRIRHVYVSPDMRGRGVGRLLVSALVDHARTTFKRVRLRSKGAPDFYLALGFEETDAEPDATHVMELAAAE